MDKKEMETRLSQFFEKNLNHPSDWLAIIRHGSTCGFLHTTSKTIEQHTSMLLFMLKYTADTAAILSSHTSLPLFEEIGSVQETYKSKLLELIELSKKTKKES